MTNPTDQARLEQIEAELAELKRRHKIELAPLQKKRDNIRAKIRMQRMRSK